MKTDTSKENQTTTKTFFSYLSQARAVKYYQKKK